MSNTQRMTATDLIERSRQLTELPPELANQPCPRCLQTRTLKLAKADPRLNTCYRCRACGHIFSPRT